MRVLAEDLAQRCVDDVGRRVRLSGAAAPVGVHDAHVAASPTPTSPAVTCDRVADESLDGPLHVEHLEVEAGADDRARVGVLTAGLGVERGLGQDHLGDLPGGRAVDRHAVDDDAEDAGLGLEVRRSR